MITSRIPQVLTKLLLPSLSFFAFDNFAHCLDIIWYKEPLCMFFFLSFQFFSFFFSFFFCFCTSLTQGKRSFSWKIFQPSLPRVRLQISILGQGYGQESALGIKGLQIMGHDLCWVSVWQMAQEQRNAPIISMKCIL